MRSDNYKTFMSSIKTQQTISLFTKSVLCRRKFKLPFFRGRSLRFPSFQQINEGAVALWAFFPLHVGHRCKSDHRGQDWSNRTNGFPALLPDPCHLFCSNVVLLSPARLVIRGLLINNEDRCCRQLLGSCYSMTTTFWVEAWPSLNSRREWYCV